MSLLRNTKLFTRLITAFVACALITRGVGLVASPGIATVSESLDGITSNNLVSIYKTSNACSNALAHYRDLHRAVLLKKT
jgi:methyl-accepting chemotaxis protein